MPLRPNFSVFSSAHLLELVFHLRWNAIDRIYPKLQLYLGYQSECLGRLFGKWDSLGLGISIWVFLAISSRSM